MSLFKKTNHKFLERSNHLIILSDDRPLDGEWAFDYRTDEKGKLHPVCYIKQDELTMFNTSTERKIIASNKLPSKNLYKIPLEQETLIKQLYINKEEFELFIEYEDDSVKLIDGYCNIKKEN